MPKQFVNREEQVTLHLECRGSGGKKCQGAATVTVQVRGSGAAAGASLEACGGAVHSHPVSLALRDA